MQTFESSIFPRSHSGQRHIPGSTSSLGIGPPREALRRAEHAVLCPIVHLRNELRSEVSVAPAYVGMDVFPAVLALVDRPMRIFSPDSIAHDRSTSCSSSRRASRLGMAYFSTMRSSAACRSASLSPPPDRSVSVVVERVVQPRSVAKESRRVRSSCSLPSEPSRSADGCTRRPSTCPARSVRRSSRETRP